MSRLKKEVEVEKKFCCRLSERVSEFLFGYLSSFNKGQFKLLLFYIPSRRHGALWCLQVGLQVLSPWSLVALSQVPRFPPPSLVVLLVKHVDDDNDDNDNNNIDKTYQRRELADKHAHTINFALAPSGCCRKSCEHHLLTKTTVQPPLYRALSHHRLAPLIRA